jgi:branched-chain amino acid transport system permease protein
MSVVVIGLSLGMLLFLLAAGLTLIFGMLGVVNFAHGALYMLGAYAAYQVVTWTGSFWIALVLSPLIVGGIGAGMEFLVLRPTYVRDHMYQLLATFGAILVFEDAVRLVYGLNYKLLATPPLLAGSIEMFGSAVSAYRLLIIGIGALVSLVLFLVLERSRVGLVVKAASVDSEMAGALGVNVARVRTLVFAVGSGLAALGGVVAGPLLNVDVGMGMAIIIDGFIVVVLGGLGNIRGAVLGALLIGMARALGQKYAPALIDLATYALFASVLLWRPQGLFNRKRRQA